MKAALAVFVAVGALACSDASQVPTAPVIGQATLANGENGQISVSGSGHFTATGEDEGFRTFSFHANRDSDGSTSGRFVAHSRQNDPDNSIKGDVVCVTVINNRAWMVGLVTESTAPTAPVGTYTRFRVADNGEGGNSAPDQISLMEVGVVGFPPYCFTVPERPALVDIEAGNVQVRGGN